MNRESLAGAIALRPVSFGEEIEQVALVEQWAQNDWQMQLLRSLSLGGFRHGLAALDWVAVRRGRALYPDAPHLATGERGELAAYFYLRRQGFTVVAQRWNDGPLPGDLDIVAWQPRKLGELLCFVEVKTRTRSAEGRDMATASAAVDENKRQILRRLARHYLRQLPGSERPEVRFDVVTVYELAGKKPEIQLIAGAFGWSERD